MSATTQLPAPARLVRSSIARGAVVAVLVLAAATLLWTPAAWAHTRLESTDPAADETTDEPFDAVVLVFSQSVTDDFAEVAVTDPTGARLDDGDPSYDGERVEQPVAELAEVGEYTVEWRVVALDGHPLEGEFTFEYDGELPEAVVEEAPETATPEDATSDAPDDVPTPDPDASTTDATEPDHGPDDDATDDAMSDDHDADDATDEDVAAVPPPADTGGGSGSSGAAVPLAVGALAIALTIGAAVYAVRSVRSWGAAPQQPA